MRFVLGLLIAASLLGETKTISLKEAVQLALRENPDLVLARIDEQKANLAIRIAKDPFRPKIIAGSGLAYSNGFPMSIEGAAPSIVQAKAVSSIFNRSYSFHVAQTIQEARTAAIDTQIKRDDIVLRTASLYLDAARWVRTEEAVRGQLDSLRHADETVQARVKEGRELEIEAKRSALALARSLLRLDQIRQERDSAEGALAGVLGLSAGDRARSVSSEPFPVDTPPSEQAGVQQALDNSKELRRLESAMLAKRHEIRQYKSNHLPSVDLVAQYGLFARFNNYEDFFRKFQRNNGQLGIALQIPLFPSAASLAEAAQAEGELSALRTQSTQARNRITLNVQNAYRQVKLSDKSREIARLDLEIARDQVNIFLAQIEEGRATLRQLEDARFQEQEKWILYFDAQFTAEKARLELLHLTGALQAALQ
ncbi:MAG: TolC family protein [Bryobacterales bacterium]|nr:TolC family protein [Bryobacterales bacterium]